MSLSRIAAIALALAGALAPLDAGARPVRWLAGSVTAVIDGDTIVVAGHVARLWGLHAPELRDAGGTAARRWMTGRALDRAVVCRLRGGRSHERLVAICCGGEGDLAGGLGRDCPRFSRRHYADHEGAAARSLPLPAHCLAWSAPGA